MKILRLLLALVLTVGLLYIAKTNSRGQPEFFSHTENGYTFEMTSVPKALVGEQEKISLKIIGPFEPGIHVTFRSSKLNQDDTTPLRIYNSTPMLVNDSADGVYYAIVTAGNKGGKLYYYFEIRDNTGGYRAGLSHPDGKPFVLKYIGEVPSWVLITHIFFMFATVFMVVMGALYGISLVKGNDVLTALSMSFVLAAVCAFLGGYPFGFMMNYYAFDTIWEGVPFGTDATDNKTQLLFIYLLFVALISRTAVAQKTIGRNVKSSKTVGWFGISAFLVLLGIYLIPHSIQFSPGLTKAICYSFITLVILMYAGWRLVNLQKVGSHSVSRSETDERK